MVTLTFCFKEGRNAGFGSQPSSYCCATMATGRLPTMPLSAGLFFYTQHRLRYGPTSTTMAGSTYLSGLKPLPNTCRGIFWECMLYGNNHDGTFTDIAAKAHCNIMAYVRRNLSDWPWRLARCISICDEWSRNSKKAVVSGWKCYKAGIASKTRQEHSPPWFYDYDNDGWSDLLVYGITSRQKPESLFCRRQRRRQAVPDAGYYYLYHNNQNGTFIVWVKPALDKSNLQHGCYLALTMTDYLDMYFGTVIQILIILVLINV